MRIQGASTKNIGIGPVKFDGWDVLLGGGLACLILGSTIDRAPVALQYVGWAALALWLVAVVLVNLGIIGKRDDKHGVGSETAADADRDADDSRA